MKISPKFDKVAKEMEALDERIRFDGLPDDVREAWGVETNVGTWSIPRTTAEFLYQLVLMKSPKVILELGTSIGYSTIWLAAAAKEIGGHVHTIEKAPYKFDSAKAYINRADVGEAVTQLQGDIREVLQEWSKPVDVIFMDANKRGYLGYIKQLEPFLQSGSMIVADNAIDMAANMEDYAKYMHTSDEYHTTLLHLDHGLLISIKK